MSGVFEKWTSCLPLLEQTYTKVHALEVHRMYDVTEPLTPAITRNKETEESALTTYFTLLPRNLKTRQKKNANILHIRILLFFPSSFYLKFVRRESQTKERIGCHFRFFTNIVFMSRKSGSRY